MKARINKIINWNGKEYAHIVEDKPAPFCDFCAFSELCSKVLSKELEYEKSPMKVCEDLCYTEEPIDFAFFIEASKAESYIRGANETK